MLTSYIYSKPLAIKVTWFRVYWVYEYSFYIIQVIDFILCTIFGIKSIVIMIIIIIRWNIILYEMFKKVKKYNVNKQIFTIYIFGMYHVIKKI